MNNYNIYIDQISGHSIIIRINDTRIAKQLSNKNKNEQRFYEWVNKSEFIPEYYGETILENNKIQLRFKEQCRHQQWLQSLYAKRFKMDNDKYILLQDLTHGFQNPSIMDIKLGFKSNNEKYLTSTSSLVGFRINGMKIGPDFYDKYWSRKLSKDELIEAFRLFKQDYTDYIEQLDRLVEFIKQRCQQVRSWDSCSVLLIHDETQAKIYLIDFQNVIIDLESDQYDENIIYSLSNLRSILASL